MPSLSLCLAFAVSLRFDHCIYFPEILALLKSSFGQRPLAVACRVFIRIARE
jgi:hypothetical protein